MSRNDFQTLESLLTPPASVGIQNKPIRLAILLPSLKRKWGEHLDTGHHRRAPAAFQTTHSHFKYYTRSPGGPIDLYLMRPWIRGSNSTQVDTNDKTSPQSYLAEDEIRQSTAPSFTLHPEVATADFERQTCLPGDLNYCSFLLTARPPPSPSRAF